MKYLADGREVEVVQELESGYLVQHYYTTGSEGDEYGLYLDRVNTLIVDRVFDAPPTAKYHESIAELNSQIEKLEESRTAKLAEIKEVTQVITEANANRKKHEQLRLLDDFITGKITHYVEMTYYNEPKIVEFKDTKSSECRDNLRLLSLFGYSNGQLDWRLNRYSDGSGGWSKVIPVTSYEDAVKTAKTEVAGKIQETEENPSIRIVDLADKWEVPVSDSYREQAVQSQRTNMLKNLEERRRVVVEIEQQLAKLDSDADAMIAEGKKRDG